jgi:hypothetical protein
MNSIGNQNNTKDAGQRTIKEQSNLLTTLEAMPAY